MTSTLERHEASTSVRFRVASALIWISVPLNALVFALAWNQLPARLATHFDFNNQPNGWMPREGAFAFFLLFAAMMAAIATWTLSRVTSPDLSAWGLAGLFYVIAGTLLWAENAVIAYNVSGKPVNVAPVLGTGIGATLLVIIVALGTRRGAALSTARLLAEENHSSPLWGLVLFTPAVAMACFAYYLPVVPLRIAIVIGTLPLLGAAVMAWAGFHYLFSSSGVEVRILGFRLRSIPAADIQSYAIDRWSALGGYGIRGVGDKRAYVWGNRGVRIKIREGEVFLGHDTPDKIVRDLDIVTHHKEHEGAPGS
jgi:hypothetical protein